MADFLSDEWIAELARACSGVVFDDGSSVDPTAPDQSAPDPSAPDPPAPFAVEPVVRGVPGRGEVRYRIVFAGATCTLVSGADAAGSGGSRSQADVHLETDYVTAVALSRGTADAQAALADGRLRVSGDVARLAEHAAALARIDDLFAALRDATTYPAP